MRVFVDEFGPTLHSSYTISDFTFVTLIDESLCGLVERIERGFLRAEADARPDA
jgi:hypothetical protein